MFSTLNQIILFERRKFMEYKFAGPREIREKIIPNLGAYEAKALHLERIISDLERCLMGDRTSTRWQELNVELTRNKGVLLNMKRRLAGRDPTMANWEDPLPD
jgi:hypothetical protein